MSQILTALVRKARAFLGTDAGPRFKFSPWMTFTESEDYSGMNQYYAEYRRDALVRRCINILASWTTKQGYQTVLEPTDPGTMTAEQKEEFVKPHLHVKSKIDRINTVCQMDWIIKVAIIKMKIFGKTGFEIVADGNGFPIRLIPLISDQLHPKLDEDWKLTSFDFPPLREREGYPPDKVLYFVNEQMEADMLGLSAIEPVMGALKTRRKIIYEDLPEAASTLWAGVAIAQVDTTGMTPTEADMAVSDFITQYKPGKIIGTNQKVKVELVDMKIKIGELLEGLDRCTDEIIGNFEVPRFLLNRLGEINRATAFAQLKALAEGPIGDLQRYYKREIERQWYNPLVRKILQTNEGEDPPVTLKHEWTPLTTEDIIEWIKTVAEAYAGGQGFIDRKKSYELLQGFGYFDPKELEPPALPPPKED